MANLCHLYARWFSFVSRVGGKGHIPLLITAGHIYIFSPVGLSAYMESRDKIPLGYSTSGPPFTPSRIFNPNALYVEME